MHGLQRMEILCTGCVSHTRYLAHENSDGEARDEHKSNSKRVVRNLEEKNVGTKGKVPNKA